MIPEKLRSYIARRLHGWALHGEQITVTMNLEEAETIINLVRKAVVDGMPLHPWEHARWVSKKSGHNIFNWLRLIIAQIGLADLELIALWKEEEK